MYVITLKCLLLLDDYLKNVIQTEWLGVLTILSPFSLDELGIV